MSDSIGKPRSHCPISYGLDIVSDRWTLLVLRDLILLGKRHFGELLSSTEGIATNILTARLKLLEAHGLVSRRRDPHSARKLIYEATAKGLDLLPMMLELARWGAIYDPETAAPKAFVRRIEKDRDALIAQIRPPQKSARR